MKLRQFIIIGSIILLLAGGVGIMKVLASFKPEVPEKKKQKTIPTVKVKTATFSTLYSKVKATGRLASQNYVDLSSEVQGRILAGRIPLKKGQHFRKGQLLLNIYDQEAQLALRAHKSRFLNKIANLLPDFKIDFISSYPKWYTFFNNTELTKPIPNLPKANSSQEKIYLASRNILSDYYSIKSEEIRLSKYRIYAPFNGSFIDVFAEVGAIANPGARLAKMVRTDKLELEVPIETQNASMIHIGDPVLIYAKGNENHKIKGQVSRKSNFVDSKTQSITFFVTLSSTKGVLQGEYLWAEFSKITIKNAMELPRTALFNSNEIYTVADGKLQKKQINILKINESTVLINGVNPGTAIVTEPLINASENTKVKTLNH